MKLSADFKDFELFINIAETDSLTRGAERSFLSTPAASVRIKQLEDGIGVKLLDRTSQGVTLTPSGQAFLHHARLMIEQLENLRSDLQDYAQGVKGHLRLVVSPSAMLDSLPMVLRDFLHAHPDVSIDLHELAITECVRALIDGTAQIGILGKPARTDNLEVIPYVSDRLALIVRPDHPLAGKTHVQFRDALSYEFVGASDSTTVFAFMRHIAESQHKVLRVKIKASTVETLCRMVEAGIGIGVASQLGARRFAARCNLKIIPLTDEAATRELIICVRHVDNLLWYARDMIDLLLANGAGEQLTSLGAGETTGARDSP